MAKLTTLRPFLYLSTTSIIKRINAFTPSPSQLSKAWISDSPAASTYLVHRRTTHRWMTTAYSGEPGDGKLGLEKISYLPIESELECGLHVHVGPFESSDLETGMDLMNLIIREGKSWPFDEEFQTMDGYKSYFLSHAAFVVRANHDWSQPDTGKKVEKGDFMGILSNQNFRCFYIKPNYPGRCSHICNGGFITAPKFREMGVAKLMGKAFCKLARDLGYKSSYFNLVFKSNTASVKLWEGLGFERVAMLEEAADLKGVDGLDTAYGYRFDLTKLGQDFQV